MARARVSILATILVTDSVAGPALVESLPQDERAVRLIAAALVAFGEQGYADTKLTDIARATGGRYFRARDAIALQAIYEQIDQLERTPVKTKSYVRFTEQYRWPLGTALLALATELGLLAWRGPLP